MPRPKGSKNKATEVAGEGVKNTPAGKEENAIYIENLPEIKKQVLALIEEKRLNPSVVHEEDAGIVFKEGEPHIIIDNQYVPHDQAKIILQTRKVVREWIRLENLKKGINELI